MSKRHRRNYEHRIRSYSFGSKPNRSRRARGKIRVRILGDKLNQRGRFAHLQSLRPYGGVS